MFESIPSIQIGDGFAVELFIIVFSVLCWLVTPEVPLASVIKEEVIPTISETLKAQEESLNNTRFLLTEPMKDEFYALLEIEKVRDWAESLGNEIISKNGDTISCPIVQYLLSTGVYESVDISSPKTVWFWTVEEIEPLTEEQINELEDVEKHSLNLPTWVTAIIPLFDEVLKDRDITGNDVVKFINQVNPF